MKTGFNIYEISATNKDLEITYTPTEDVSKYEYAIYKNDLVETQNTVLNSKPTNFLLTETGNFKIKVVETKSDGSVNTYVSGLYVIDKQKPVIIVGEKNLTMELGSRLFPMEGVIVRDNLDSNLIDKVTTNYDELDFTTTGLKTLTYTVTDSAGNTASENIYIRVVPSREAELEFFQLGIIFILGIIILLTLLYRKSMRLQDRIGKFGIEPISDNTVSLFEGFHKKYIKLLEKFSKILEKSVVLKDYSKKYDKYINSSNNGYISGIYFVANKIIVAFVVLLIAIFSKTIQFQVLDVYEIIFPLIFGFYVPDFLYIYEYRKYRSLLENDLLQAIMVMNNAFKSGRSITQAIDLVTTELDGPISHEFKKMAMELSFGLSIEDVFGRFNERVDMEEVAYLTASLTILNKTGGNIIKVFSSIEKSLFNKKKLKLELLSLTGSSKIIMYVLFCVPILFITFVSILNPNYFAPFFTTSLGGVLMVLILIMYIAYIIIVRKIMKVRM